MRKDQNIVKKVALETAKTTTVSLSEVVLRSQNEYGQTKSVKSHHCREENTSSAEGAELARREVDEITSRVR